jgi:hypothetical protein
VSNIVSIFIFADRKIWDSGQTHVLRAVETNDRTNTKDRQVALKAV